LILFALKGNSLLNWMEVSMRCLTKSLKMVKEMLGLKGRVSGLFVFGIMRY